MIYRTEQGVRKIINNFGHVSPLGQELMSPASSSSSVDPECAIRVVPEYTDYNITEQSRFRRILTPVYLDMTVFTNTIIAWCCGRTRTDIQSRVYNRVW